MVQLQFHHVSKSASMQFKPEF
uniref:Uncharacterized protein n=1 Tax=Arundo donax TaxID=35708 RepID=A0A0A8XSA5_ARUDO